MFLHKSNNPLYNLKTADCTYEFHFPRSTTLKQAELCVTTCMMLMYSNLYFTRQLTQQFSVKHILILLINLNTWYLILVGQCGNQIGSDFWPLLLEEYGILSSSTNSSLNASFKLDKSFNSFFNCPEGASKLGSLMDLSKSKVTARVSFLYNEMKNGFIF